MPTWTVTCPMGGVYAGEGHYFKKGEGLTVHLKKVVKIKSPRGETCEGEETNSRGNPHSLTACERRHLSVRKERARCISSVEIKACGKRTKDYSKCKANPIAVCRATIPCP